MSAEQGHVVAQYILKTYISIELAQQLIKQKLLSILMASGQGQQCAQLKIGQYYYEGTEISKNFKKYSSIIRWQQTKGAQKPNAMLKSATMKEQEHFPVQTNISTLIQN